MAHEYSQKLMTIVAEIDVLMQPFTHTKKDIGYGYRWTFANGQWIDVIDYKKQDIYILRVGRGAWFVRKYPMLYGLFDEVLVVISKLRIKGVETLYEKHIKGVLELLDQAPKGIKYND